MTRTERIRDRAALVDDFAKRIRAAVWEGIEAADPELLAADDGIPYLEPEIARMVENAVRSVERSLRNYL